MLPRTKTRIKLSIIHELAKQLFHRVFINLYAKRKPIASNGKLEELFTIYNRMCSILLAVDPESGFITALKTLNLAEQTGDKKIILSSTSWLGVMYDFAHMFPAAERLHDKAEKLALTFKDPVILSTIYLSLSLHQNFIGQFKESVRYARYAAEHLSIGDHWDIQEWGTAKRLMCLSLIHLGRFDESLKLATELAEAGENSADKEMYTQGLLLRGFALRGLGDLEEAISVLTAVLELSLSISSYLNYPDIAGELGQCYLCVGKINKAFEIFEECRKIVIEHNLLKSPTLNRYINGYTEACLITAEESENREKQEWLKKAKKACGNAIKYGKFYTPELPEAMFLFGWYKLLKGKLGAAKKQWDRSIAMAEKMEIDFDLGRILFEIGKRTGSREYLERAKVLFEKSGSKWDLKGVLEELKY
jgi:tetratricopeptide (TPR) repeat protein